MIQGTDKVDPFDVASFGMVVMPADDVVLVRVGLFGNAVIDDQHAILSLHRPHMRLHDLPQDGGGQDWPRQDTLYLVVADTAFPQISQPRSRRWPLGTDQIVTVEVALFVLVHALSLQRSSCQ